VQQSMPNRLAEYVDAAIATVPYYRRHRHEYLGRSFEQLPLLSKQQLRAGFPSEFLAAMTPVSSWIEAGRCEVLSTSGTGSDKLFVVANTRLPAFPSALPALWGLPEDAPLRRVAVVSSPSCAGGSCAAGYEGRLFGGGGTLISAMPADLSEGEGRARAIVEDLWRFGPDLFFANPSYLLWLARSAQSLGLSLPRVSVVISAYQFTQRCTARAIESLLGCRVLGNYAASDLAGCQAAFECHRGRYHVFEEQCHVEALDASGSPSLDRLGRLAITTVGNDLYPLVRYLVGDLGIVRAPSCDCPLGAAPVVEIFGRGSEVTFAEGSFTTCRELDQLVSGVEGIDTYRLVQLDAAHGILEVVLAPGAEPDLTALCAAVQDRTRIAQVQPRIEAQLSPERGLKFSTIRSYHGRAWGHESSSNREQT